MKQAAGAGIGVPAKRRTAFPPAKTLWKYKELYLILLPTIVFFLIFSYYPYYGMTIAFKDFSPVKGISGSPWVGLDYFRALFEQSDFYNILGNTLSISLYKLLFGFPVPILFAVLLSEIRSVAFKKTIQTITYFPHFLSWVIFGGIVLSLLAPQGPLAGLFAQLHLPFAQNVLTDARAFRALLVVTNILKEFGWGAIIYLAALAGIDPALYEAARMDGAGRWAQLLHVTLPGLRSVAVLMFVLQLGGILDAGFEQIFIMYNPAVYSTTDIIDTFVYRTGLGNGDYSTATAVGLFKGLIGFILIFGSNAVIKRMGEPTLW